MHAIIHKEDGGYYVSPVFGFYKHIKAKDEYKKYLESIHKPFYGILIRIFLTNGFRC